MRNLLVSLILAAFVIGLAGCTPQADTSKKPEEPLPKGGPQKLDTPPVIPKKK